MPGSIYNMGATVICPHGGQVQPVPTAVRVQLGGAPPIVATDQCMVAGCAFTLPNGKPSPCIKVQWTAPATRVLIDGKPPLIQSSVGLCQSPEQVPQGPATLASLQTRVIAS